MRLPPDVGAGNTDEFADLAGATEDEGTGEGEGAGLGEAIGEATGEGLLAGLGATGEDGAAPILLYIFIYFGIYNSF